VSVCVYAAVELNDCCRFILIPPRSLLQVGPSSSGQSSRLQKEREALSSTSAGIADRVTVCDTAHATTAENKQLKSRPECKFVKSPVQCFGRLKCCWGGRCDSDLRSTCFRLVKQLNAYANRLLSNMTTLHNNATCMYRQHLQVLWSNRREADQITV